MKQAFRYRIFPTKHQQATLRSHLSLCCELYNAGLEERREAYRMVGKNITFTEQSAQLPDLKELRPAYKAITKARRGLPALAGRGSRALSFLLTA